MQTSVITPVIAGAHIGAGHDGAAELIVRLRFGNGASDSVTLDATAAARLLTLCGVDSIDDLAGQPWQHLLHVLDTPSGAG